MQKMDPTLIVLSQRLSEHAAHSAQLEQLINVDLLLNDIIVFALDLHLP